MEKQTNKLYEVDLYEPIRKHFKNKGYKVDGEVKNCDVVAVKEEELIIVELKLTLNVDLLIQASKRQRLTDQVYIAIPKPKYSLRSSKWRDICYLVRRLGLGLIIVSFQKNRTRSEIIITPGPFDRLKSMQINQYRRNSVIKEINGRFGDFNPGGSNKTKILTAYKQNCIHIAFLLGHSGPLSPKALRELGTGDKTISILNKNYYGWFNRVKRGMYEITEKGKQELEAHPELLNHYEKQLIKIKNSNIGE